MRTEEIFKQGVTPKSGDDAGKRFRVLSIYPDRTIVCDWDDESAVNQSWKDGTFELWRPPKTLFEDDDIIATVGELKKAIEESGLDDNTRIYVSQGNFFTTFSSGALVNPSFRLTKVYSSHGNDSKTAIVIS